MTATYPATLLNGQLTWGIQGQPELPPGVPVHIEVTVHRDEQKELRKKKLREAFDKLAASGIVTDEFYQEWLESRKDKPLYGREE